MVTPRLPRCSALEYAFPVERPTSFALLVEVSSNLVVLIDLALALAVDGPIIWAVDLVTTRPAVHRRVSLERLAFALAADAVDASLARQLHTREPVRESSFAPTGSSR